MRPHAPFEWRIYCQKQGHQHHLPLQISGVLQVYQMWRGVECVFAHQDSGTWCISFDGLLYIIWFYIVFVLPLFDNKLQM